MTEIPMPQNADPAAWLAYARADTAKNEAAARAGTLPSQQAAAAAAAEPAPLTPEESYALELKKRTDRLVALRPNKPGVLLWADQEARKSLDNDRKSAEIQAGIKAGMARTNANYQLSATLPAAAQTLRGEAKLRIVNMRQQPDIAWNELRAARAQGRDVSRLESDMKLAGFNYKL